MNNLLQLKTTLKDKIKSRFPNLVTNIYLFCLAFYIFSTFIKNTSMQNNLINQRTIYLLAVIPSFFVMVKIFIFDDNSLENLMFFLLLECLLFITGRNAANFNVFYYGIFIYGAKNVDFNKILKVFIVVVVSGILLSIFLVFLHIIPNIKIIRSPYDPVTRYALGANYPSDFAARGFSLLLAYAVLKKFNLNLPEYIAYIAIILWFYILTDTRLDLVLMILLFLTLLFFKKIKIIFTKNILNANRLTILMYLYIGIILFLGYAFSFAPHNPILKIINKLLSGRLTYEAFTIKNYHILMGGQFIFQPGGGKFYIDSVFFRTLWMYGLPLFIILLFLIWSLNKKFMINKTYYLVICFALFILGGGIDQHFWNISYNFTLLALFANLERRKYLACN